MREMTGKRSILGGYSRFERRNFVFLYTLIAVPVLHFIVFWVYVNLSSLMLAFEGYDGSFTLAHFKQVIDSFAGKTSTELGPMLGRSFLVWTVSNLICFPICVITTYVLFKKIFGHYVFRVIYIIPSLLGAVIWTTLIKFIVSNDGPIVEVLTKMGVELPEFVMRNGLFGSEKTAFPTLIFITFIMGIVGSNAVLTGAFTRIPDEIFESSRLDGASFWREFFSISLPCVWPTVATLMTFSLCGMFTAEANVFLYTNGTGEPGMATMGYHLYYLTVLISQNGQTGAGVFGYPAALGLTLTFFTVPIVLIGRRVLESLVEPVEY